MFRLLPILLALCWGSASATPTPRTMAALPLAVVAGRGAAVPFDEYEAENGAYRGTLLGPDRTFTSIAAEASGRRAVRLDAIGDYVEIILARPANALVVRAAIPDGAGGEGRDATLSLAADGRPLGRLRLTSRYGWYYGAYPFTNRPGDGGPHHMFDEARLLLGRTLPAGTRLRLYRRAQDRAAWYAIDLIDCERVDPPRRPPSGSIPVTAFGADPTGGRPAAAAFQAAIAAASARHVPLWIPPGDYAVDGHLLADRVHIYGAGPWYSVVHGAGIGFYGHAAPAGSIDVRLEGFAIMGDVTERIDHDQVNGVGGAMGGGSVLRDLWIQHTKVGLWFDGPMRGIRISRLRILDTAADGLNFRRGVSDAVVENVFVRNSGDDALPAWSQREADHDILFRHDTVIAPLLANGVAIYGGHDIEVRDTLVADTLTEGGGLHLGNRFDAVPASGHFLFADDLVVRSGGPDPHWHFGIGALWFYALDAPIAARIVVARTTLCDGSAEAVQFLGKPIGSVRFDRLRIDGTDGAAFQLQSAGIAAVEASTLRALGGPTVLRCHDGFLLSGELPRATEAGCPPG